MTLAVLGLLFGMVGLLRVVVIDITRADYQTIRQILRAQHNISSAVD